jgi:pimeloyl-ACP methyl ester carboxylesterase
MIDGGHTLINAMQDKEIQSLRIRANGHRLHCLRAGSGPSIVLLHGGASDSRDWVGTMADLSHSHTLHAPDMLGFGRSDKSKAAYCLREFVESTLEFIRGLDFDSHVLVGHSIGGRVCLEIALRHPEIVRRLVLVDTAGFGKLARWGMYLGAVMYWLRKMLRREQPYPRFLKEDGEDRDWRCLGRLHELSVPTLIVWNRRDPYYPVSHAFAANKLMPNVQLAVFPGFGHAPHVQRSNCFNELLLEFLGSS